MSTEPDRPSQYQRGRFVLVHQAVVVVATIVSAPALGLLGAVTVLAPLLKLRGATRRDANTVLISVALGVATMALVFGAGVAMLAYGLGHDRNWR
ncbi:hypothetical protein [Massilia sp. CT11-137]|uniref:hypothetical protein n=1 Tax=Massilia sp. CT11-137 TaxID=3393901 RepID=UPI0039A4646F